MSRVKVAVLLGATAAIVLGSLAAIEPSANARTHCRARKAIMRWHTYQPLVLRARIKAQW